MSVAVNITLNDVSLFFGNVHHAGLHLFIHVDVTFSPLLLVVDLDYVTNDVRFSVVGKAACGAFVWVDPGCDVEHQMFQELSTPVKHLVTVETL